MPAPHEMPENHVSGADVEQNATPEGYFREQLQQRDSKPVTCTAEPGDVLIWHSQLLHGGSAITDAAKTRRSLVTHYFRQQDYRHHFWQLRK